MADEKGPGGTGKTGPGNEDVANLRDDDLERRRRELGAKLATRRPDRLEGEDTGQTRSVSGYAQAFKLSSEFIAAIAVGIGIGWVLDRWAGTSPWGLIVFLLLGFCAGILNVLRAAGLVADFGRGGKRSGGQD
ncbi:AtpZ/AtpI family protein [Mesorhizobium sp. 8]|jgi:ATP synthase protein I|uniref:AtpZ/AtpI family protein n=1 Tax=Mesorhizobium sp. 8 TaxID=2584466 RepID=UPI00111FA5F6|nr:AtpZ/AtpI family protein [Mesorhizobium sp. 8]QDC01999.1 ATP F0F1 synthase subunit I [Mesorhizobium sp. 8]